MANKFPSDNISIDFSKEIPVISLKNIVLFPKVAIPLVVQSKQSLFSLERSMDQGSIAIFVAQKPNFKDGGVSNLYEVGTVGRIFDVHRLNDGSFKIDIEGIARVRINKYRNFEGALWAEAFPIDTKNEFNIETQTLMKTATDLFKKLMDLQGHNPPAPIHELFIVLSQLKDPQQLIDLLVMHVRLVIPEQQDVLETLDTQESLKKLIFFISREIQVIETEKKVAKETKKQLGKMQKEIFLREQMRSIEKELGLDDDKSEFDTLRNKIEAAGMPANVKPKALKELGRLEKMPPFSPEVSYLRTYLDWLIELPWLKHSDNKIDLTDAQKILDQDHYGLEKVKERILEFLAVQKNVGKIRGPILCFVGPPGVGKTSIGRSIAKALNRKFTRISLGGLRDEAEIRGHRRTYVGAMPGRLVQGIHTAKSKNPVFMLDELDKIGTDFRGDPASALLEALDPEQNHAFSDHYLEVPFDLSDVFFVATANRLDTIPPALRDRLEIIEFSGYTEAEKLHIAKKFLSPKVIKEHGLKMSQVKLNDKILKNVIQNYTREAGVRNLERQVSTLVRKITRNIVEKKAKTPIVLNEKNIVSYLGQAKYSYQQAEVKDEIGVVSGLAWTSVGGEVLTVEVTKMQGKGKLLLTGQLGDVMKESAQAALSYARAQVEKMGVDFDFHKEDIHLHLPSGAIPKDGPSAGITMATAFVSLFTGRPVRKDVGMTGEITLRGKVLEIGGLKEKVLGAHRAGLKVIIAPFENKKDLDDIPKEIQKDLTFHWVKTADEVLKIALTK